MAKYPDGLGGGVETSRSYVAESFPTGSQRAVMRWLRSLIGREDVVRVWLTPVGSKTTVWEHRGPLRVAPDLDELFNVDEAEPLAA